MLKFKVGDLVELETGVRLFIVRIAKQHLRPIYYLGLGRGYASYTWRGSEYLTWVKSEKQI